MAKLTNKQRTFCQEYIIDLNATQAAIRSGYSEKTAECIGYENLRKPQINEVIQSMMEERAEKTGLSAETILNNIIEIEALSKGANKYNEALKANELLGKHLKLFTDRLELSGNVNISFNNEDKLED